MPTGTITPPLTAHELRSLAAVATIRAEETRRYGAEFDDIPAARWDQIADILTQQATSTDDARRDR